MGCAQGKSTAAQEPSIAGRRESAAGMRKLDHTRFVADHPIGEQICEFYQFERNSKLGEGTYGSVVKGRNKATDNIRAVKKISKEHVKSIDKFKREIRIMKELDHPNIIKLYECFEDNRNIYLVMTLCNGGELFDKIIEAGHFSEPQAAILMQQVVRAIFYMHQHNVAHRDLKPENFLLLTREPVEQNVVKVIDFGLSCNFEDGVPLTTKVGTPYYVAPQVLHGKYTQACDMWSIGVIMFLMLSGYPPFYGETDTMVLNMVRSGNYAFNADDWRLISEDAKELIRQLLKMRQHERYTAEQALTHEWIKNKAPAAKGVSLQPGFVDNLRCFRSQNKLKKAALHIIACQLEDSEIKALRETFEALDSNSDGLLTALEMTEGLQKAGLKEIPADLKQILESIDSNASGVIDYTEFLAATLEKRAYLQKDQVWTAFSIFDKNNDGKISKAELAQVLESEAVTEVAKEYRCIADLIAEIDRNHDGEIDFDEFMEMMRGPPDL